MTNSMKRVQTRSGLLVRWCLVLAAGVLAGTVRTEAEPVLPAFSALTQCASGQLGQTGDSGGCSQSSGDGSDSITISTFPFASLQTQAAVVAGVRDSFSGFAVLNYSFEVIGGTLGDQVPLLIAANLGAQSSGGPGISAGYAFSEIIVTTSVSGASETICTAFCGAGTGDTSFSGLLSATAASGVVDTVHLEIEASTSSLPALGITASAGADPFIYVDPSFAGASQYSILVSSDVGNAIPASTPEPGSLSIGAIGMGAILAARRRWRQRFRPAN